MAGCQAAAGDKVGRRIFESVTSGWHVAMPTAGLLRPWSSSCGGRRVGSDYQLWPRPWIGQMSTSVSPRTQ